MFKSVICSVNSQYIHASPAPWCLQAGVRAYCTTPQSMKIVEGTVNEPAQALLDRLAAEDARVYGFCCYIWNILRVRELVDGLRRSRPEAVIVLGGPEVSFCAEEALRALPADFIIVGEGERPFALLLDALAGKGELAAVPGLCRREGGRICLNRADDSRALPVMPDYADYTSRLGGRIAYLETSRGCPFSCAYCLSGRSDPVRFYPLEDAKRALLQAARSGAKTVKLVDRTFNCDPPRTAEILRFLIKERGHSYPQDVCFHFEVGADLFDEAALSLLEQSPAGLFQLEAGLQSFHPQTLDAVSRKTDPVRLKANLERLIRCRRIHIHIDLIAGLPFEGFEQFGRSFDEAFALHADMLQLGFLKLIHGSRLREQAASCGLCFSGAPPYEITSTPWLSAGELERLHRTEDALQRLYNSARFRFTVSYILHAAGLRPFELFTGFGDYTSQKDLRGISLDAYTSLVWEWARQLPGVREERLRDVMVCDRLAGVAGGKLPPCLKRYDRRLASLAEAARKREGLSPGRCGAALLEGFGERLVLVDPSKRDPISGRFRLIWLKISDIE